MNNLKTTHLVTPKDVEMVHLPPGEFKIHLFDRWSEIPDGPQFFNRLGRIKEEITLSTDGVEEILFRKDEYVAFRVVASSTEHKILAWNKWLNVPMTLSWDELSPVAITPSDGYDRDEVD